EGVPERVRAHVLELGLLAGPLKGVLQRPDRSATWPQEYERPHALRLQRAQRLENLAVHRHRAGLAILREGCRHSEELPREVDVGPLEGQPLGADPDAGVDPHEKERAVWLGRRGEQPGLLIRLQVPEPALRLVESFDETDRVLALVQLPLTAAVEEA